MADCDSGTSRSLLPLPRIIRKRPFLIQHLGRQGNEFADAHAGGIEQFEQRQHAQALQVIGAFPAASCSAWARRRVTSSTPSVFGNARPFFGASRMPVGIVRAQTLGIEELVELAHAPKAGVPATTALKPWRERPER